MHSKIRTDFRGNMQIFSLIFRIITSFKFDKETRLSKKESVLIAELVVLYDNPYYWI
jgi:hypothetical protein